jgi:hypothetical protein
MRIYDVATFSEERSNEQGRQLRDRTQNCWTSGRYASSGIVNTRKHNVVQGPNRVGVSLFSPDDGNKSNIRKVVLSTT